jgi:hypothetical protein
VATPPTRPRELRQHSRVSAPTDPTGTGWRWMSKTSAEGRARSSRKAGPNPGLLLDGLRERIDPRKALFVSRHGREYDDCGVAWLQKRPSVDVCGQYARIVRH